MARRERVLRVFVAAPSDVEREVRTLRKIVDQLNQDHGPHLNVRVRVLNWKSDVVPAMGQDAQTVIFDQIPTDSYDVFVGILWTRFGTPTPRAESGTEEEFRKAYARWSADHDSLRIMMYFSNIPAPPFRIDPEQLAKVHRFRAEIQVHGIASNINSKKEFEDLAAKHLAALMHIWKKPSKRPRPNKIEPIAQQWAKFLLRKKRVPFRELQDADYVERTISRTAAGFRLKIEIPKQPYWRAGFVLAPESYIRDGRTDTTITRYFLFHIGRGEPSDPKKKTGLHYQVYYKDQRITPRMPFESSNAVELNVAFNSGGRHITIDFAGVRYEQEIDPDYFRYLYALAWADWFDQFRVPVELKLL
ncbi:MAG: DUF4062 domain-containing protein [Acidobacteriia bacterium]|nr:DUF4062 domain-containing protein [Terriglobia bacterium]